MKKSQRQELMTKMMELKVSLSGKEWKEMLKMGKVNSTNSNNKLITRRHRKSQRDNKIRIQKMKHSSHSPTNPSWKVLSRKKEVKTAGKRRKILKCWKRSLKKFLTTTNLKGEILFGIMSQTLQMMSLLLGIDFVVDLYIYRTDQFNIVYGFFVFGSTIKLRLKIMLICLPITLSSTFCDTFSI